MELADDHKEKNDGMAGYMTLCSSFSTMPFVSVDLVTFLSRTINTVKARRDDGASGRCTFADKPSAFVIETPSWGL
jgi:hypothetical protein